MRNSIWIQATSLLVAVTSGEGHRHLRSTAFMTSKCGGAVNMGAEHCLTDLWIPTNDNLMPCFAYGGPEDPCSLNMNNDPNYGMDKDPSLCKGDTFYLWDEPDTQGQSYQWAGLQWVMYSTKWATQIQEMRKRGVRFTSPLMKADNIPTYASAFFSSCGSNCSNPNSTAYIDVFGVNVFCGPWNTEGKTQEEKCRGGIRYTMDQFRYSVPQKLPIYITNWSRLQVSQADDQIPAIDATDEFFSPEYNVERVYWFGATDYGGGSWNNFLVNATSAGSTLGQLWHQKCLSM